MPLTDGIVDTSLIQAAAEAAHLGVITDYVGLASKELRFMTIGAQDVHAFVGLNGPDWVDADGDGEIDRDSPARSSTPRSTTTRSAWSSTTWTSPWR